MKWVWKSLPDPFLDNKGYYILRLHTLDGGMLHRCEYLLKPYELHNPTVLYLIKQRMKRKILVAIVEKRENIGR